MPTSPPVDGYFIVPPSPVGHAHKHACTFVYVPVSKFASTAVRMFHVRMDSSVYPLPPPRDHSTWQGPKNEQPSVAAPSSLSVLNQRPHRNVLFMKNIGVKNRDTVPLSEEVVC